MISRTIVVAALAVTFQLLTAEPGAAAGKLSLTFEADGAVVSGVTPGASVVWLGVSRSRGGWLEQVHHWRWVTDPVGKDGVARYPRLAGFPQQTTMIAVDVSTGKLAYGATSPLNGVIPAPEFDGATRNPAGLLTSFTQRGSRIGVLVVRVGVGVWGGRVADGSPLDLDGTGDGLVRIGFEGLRSLLPKADPLDGVRPGDVVAVADAQAPWVRVATVEATDARR